MLISNTTHNHKTKLDELLNAGAKKLIIVSPFLASSMQDFLSGFDFSNLKKIDLVTTFKPNDAEQFTKPFQLRDIINFFSSSYPDIKVVIHVDNSLHGKLYVSRGIRDYMILTSANFTISGMFKNHEWGLWVQDVDIINQAIEEVFDNIDYPELSEDQISKACLFAEGNIKENPTWSTRPTIKCDILNRVYSDSDEQNDNPQYILKPIGDSKEPVRLEDKWDFSELHQKLHFSKRKPSGVRKGDFIITTAIGAGSLLSFFRVTGGIEHVTREQKEEKPWLDRWPWYVEARNNSTAFGGTWWSYDLKRQDLLEEFKELHPDTPITAAGGFTLGALNLGSDKLKLTKEFGEFLINKITEHQGKKH